MFNLLTSFAVTFLLARSITYGLRRRRRVGPFRNLRVGSRHIHHFVPGIVLAFGAGAGRDPDPQRGARAAAGGAVRRRDGADARRVGAAARARRRLLDARGHAQRADHARGDRDARLRGARPALPAPRRAGRARGRRPRERSAAALGYIRAMESGPPPPDRPDDGDPGEAPRRRLTRRWSAGTARPGPQAPAERLGGPQAPAQSRRRRQFPPAGPRRAGPARSAAGSPPAPSGRRPARYGGPVPPGGWQAPLSHRSRPGPAGRWRAGAAAWAPRCSTA